MKNIINAQEIVELLESGNYSGLQEAVEEIHPAELAEIVSSLEDDDLWRFFSAIPRQQSADVFSHIDLDRQVELAGEVNRQAMARMLEDLPHDDRADLVQRLDEQVREQILPLVAKAEREDIRKLTSYEEGTVGALMSSDYASLKAAMTAGQSIDHLRIQAPTLETIYYMYVVDDSLSLIGFVSLKDLIIAKPSQLVRDVMHEDVISANVGDDQETAARKIEKYDLLAIPVIDNDGRLVGIVTHDDALDVIRQEQQEDVEKLMAISGRHHTYEYLRTSSAAHFKNRVLWIVILSVVGLVSGLIVQRFEGLLLQFAILAAFMPMLADTGGNTGSQSATLVVRALALEEIKPRDILRVLFKELQVSLMLAVVLAIVAFGRVLVFGGASTIPDGFSLVRIGAVISLALGLQVITSTLLGALLPLIAAKMKWDPAIVASPALTTFVDITGLLIFFGTAKLFLGASLI